MPRPWRRRAPLVEWVEHTEFLVVVGAVGADRVLGKLGDLGGEPGEAVLGVGRVVVMRGDGPLAVGELDLEGADLAVSSSYSTTSRTWAASGSASMALAKLGKKGSPWSSKPAAWPRQSGRIEATEAAASSTSATPAKASVLAESFMAVGSPG